MSFAGGYLASSSLADPPGSSVLLPAVAWLEGTLLGTVATLAAIVAIAAVGFMLLSGRLAVRRGLAAVLGCFVLFGAAAIAAGIRASAGDPGEPRPAAPPPPEPLADLAPQPRPPAPKPPGDPFAGASVPTE